MQSGPTNKCKFYRWNVYAQARGPPYPLYYYCQISCETISYGILLLATASLHIMHNIKEYCHHNTINSWSSKTLTYMRLVRHLNVKFSLFCLKSTFERSEPTVLCSSPSLVLKLCSKMEYMIRPIPKDGSITDGTYSSTVEIKSMMYLVTKSSGFYNHTSL